LILYKYVSFKGAVEIIKNSSIGFRGNMLLNDPFEGSYFGFEQGQDISPNLAMNAVRSRVAANYALLSLTRQPHNSLMWAHYGDSHKGIVIGINVEKAGFTDHEKSIVPIQYGEIIYTSTKPQNRYAIPSQRELMDIGRVAKFEANSYNLLKRAFLYKSLEWAYEEEVRVVKSITTDPYLSKGTYGTFENASGKWNRIEVDNKPLDCFEIPRESIVSVHLGHYFDKDNMETVNDWRQNGIEVISCKADLHSWDLVSSSVD
jgi:hypothetical protein